MARGYLNHAELTREKFVPDPFRSQSSARLYRTGDLVKYSSDGRIHYLSRTDNQVKIRGFRVELGEIESILSQHSDVREAVVIVREDTAGDKRLVGYLILKDGQTKPSVSDLRTFARERLPDYMIPSTFVFLEMYPLTPNKKIDRKALPSPDQTRPELADQYAAPRDEVEEELARIISTLLHLERVGIYDDFFELGGHSLLAAQVISRIQQNLNVSLPLKSLFEAPTVANLAVLVLEKKLSQLDTRKLMALLAKVEDQAKQKFHNDHTST